MGAALLDFVLRALAVAIGLVLIAGAFDKLRDWQAFRAALAGYRLLPSVFVEATAVALPLAEAVAGAALLVDASRIVGAWLGIAVIGFATAGVAINVARGRTHIDCGCGGVEGRQRLSWALVVRNLVLAALLALGARVPVLDVAGSLGGATLVLAALAFFALFAAASQLVANRQLLTELVNRS
jgi:methylamine utilization protein MauE